MRWEVPKRIPPEKKILGIRRSVDGGYREGCNQGGKETDRGSRDYDVETRDERCSNQRDTSYRTTYVRIQQLVKKHRLGMHLSGGAYDLGTES